MKLRIVLGIGLAAGVAALAWAALAPRVEINGRNASDAVLESGGNTYVSVADLERNGASVQRLGDGSLSIRFVGLRGAGPMPAMDGRLGEWVNNGLLRVRITNPRVEDKQFRFDLEAANLASLPTDPGVHLGLRKPTVVDERGNSLPDAVGGFGQWDRFITRRLLPGQTGIATLTYGVSGAEPDRVILEFEYEGNTAKITAVDQRGGFTDGPDMRIVLRP